MQAAYQVKNVLLWIYCNDLPTGATLEDQHWNNTGTTGRTWELDIIHCLLMEWPVLLINHF